MYLVLRLELNQDGRSKTRFVLQYTKFNCESRYETRQFDQIMCVAEISAKMVRALTQTCNLKIENKDITPLKGFVSVLCC